MPKNTCPVCQANLPGELVASGRIECPSCGTKLKLAYSRRYLCARGLTCYGVAVAFLWRQGFHDAFQVFILSFVALPAIWLWDIFIRPFYPPDRIVPVQGPIQTLDLQQ